jgi:hypothetical protein
MIGATLGNSEIHTLLGRGGLGEVYQAKDRKLRHSCGGEYAQNSNPDS